MVRASQLLDQLRHRLSYIPFALTVAALILARIMLAVDRSIAQDSLPALLRVSVDSGRAVLGSLAGGLISSVALLLSLTLVVVQLASSQFSPRTSRDWLGDRTQQLAIGGVLATAVYCLVILREVDAMGVTESAPHLSVLVGLVLGVVSLVGVVRSVDALANSVRISSVTRRITDETVDIIDRSADDESQHRPGPALDQRQAHHGDLSSADVTLIVTEEVGWIQQIDIDAIFDQLPDEAGCRLLIPLGGFVGPSVPVMAIEPPVDADRCQALRETLAIGETRTMQHDVGFGLVRLVDIALRALSPGVNDPNTAIDVIVHLGAIMVKAWEQPEAAANLERGTRRIQRPVADHRELLHDAFDAIRRYGADDPEVIRTLVQTLTMLRSEAVRRRLPGPTLPIDEFRDELVADFMDNSSVSPPTRERFARSVSVGVEVPDEADRPPVRT